MKSGLECSTDAYCETNCENLFQVNDCFLQIIYHCIEDRDVLRVSRLGSVNIWHDLLLIKRLISISILNLDC